MFLVEMGFGSVGRAKRISWAGSSPATAGVGKVSMVQVGKGNTVGKAEETKLKGTSKRKGEGCRKQKWGEGESADGIEGWIYRTIEV